MGNDNRRGKRTTAFRRLLNALVPPIFRKKSWGELHSFFDTMIAGGGGKSTIKSQIAEYRSWVNIATSVIYRRVSTVNFKYFREDTGEEIKRGSTTFKVIDKIFKDPNPYMEMRFIKQYIQLQLDLTGMAFCWRVDDPIFHLPKEIWPLNTNDLVAIEISANTNTGVYPTRIGRSSLLDTVHPFRNWIIGFTFAIGGRHITIGWDNILYFHYPHPKDPRVGSSPIQSQAYAVDVDHYIEAYERDFFKNNARPDFALKYPETVSMDEDDADRIRTGWKKKFQGEGKNFELAILDRGADIYEFGPKNEDLQLMFLAGWSQDKVLASYGVPPGKVGMVKDVNRANAEGIDITFNSESIKPRLDLIDEVFSRGVLQKFDPRYIMKHENPIPRDRKQDIEEIKTKVGTPIWTPNEARAMEGKKPQPGGDVIYVQMQYVPMGYTPPVPKASDGGSEEEDSEGEQEGAGIKTKSIVFKEDRKSEEWRERKWKIMDLSATQWESVWKSRLRVLFTRQQDEVLENLNKYAPKSISTFRKKGKIKKNFILLYKKNLYNYIGLHKEKAAQRIRKDINQLDRLLLIKEQEFYDIVIDGFIRERTMEEILIDIDNFFVKKQDDVIDHILFDYDENEELFSEEAKRIHSNIMLESGQAVLDELGIDIDFTLGSPMANKYLGEKVSMFSTSVLSTKADQLRRTLAEGLANGESMQKLSSRVRGVYDSVLTGGYQAGMIARTETIGSLNAGKMDGYNQSGIVKEKEWLSSRSANTRGAAASDQADHFHMDGQKVSMDKPFVDPRSGARMMFPGDSSMGAGGKDIINCRCSMLGNLEVTKEEDVEDVEGVIPEEFVVSPELKKEVEKLKSPHNFMTKSERHSLFLDRGYTIIEIEEMDTLIYELGITGKSQEAAKKKILQIFSEKDSRLYHLFTTQIEVETTLNSIWYASIGARAANVIDRYKLEFFSTYRGEGMYYGETWYETWDDLYEMLKYEYIEAPKYIYRKGKIGEFIESWTSDDRGASIDGVYVGWDHKYDMGILEDKGEEGYSVLGGGTIFTGAPGEAELTLFNNKYR